MVTRRRSTTVRFVLLNSNNDNNSHNPNPNTLTTNYMRVDYIQLSGSTTETFGIRSIASLASFYRLRKVPRVPEYVSTGTFPTAGLTAYKRLSSCNQPFTAGESSVVHEPRGKLKAACLVRGVALIALIFRGWLGLGQDKLEKKYASTGKCLVSEEIGSYINLLP
jgi:hypothetical protein